MIESSHTLECFFMDFEGSHFPKSSVKQPSFASGKVQHGQLKLV